MTRRLGPARIGWGLGLNPSTVHRVLRRYHCHRLAHLDRATRLPVRRYERDRPGELVHVDVKKLGTIPDGGGHRYTSRQESKRNALASAPVRKNSHPVLGYSYLHSALDDHTRLVYTEILADERKATAAAFLHRAHAWFTSHGITIERILTDIQAGCCPGRPRVVRPAV